MNSSFWLELLARSGALLLAAELVLRLPLRLSAAVRHRFLLWVLALLAVLPVMAFLIPEIPLFVGKPEPTQRALVTILEISSRTLGTSVHHSVNLLLWLWITGMVIACVPLVTGMFFIRRIARRAKPLSDEVLITSELRIPMTCGILKPRVLLPAEAEHWSASRLQAVLSHERAHIRRRDVAAQVTAHVIAAIWWFQPLVWLVRHRLRTESEFACDAEAVGSGFLASDYASELVAVAKGLSPDSRVPGPAIAMIRSSDLEKRVRAVLHPPSTLPRSARIYMLGLFLAGTAIAASAVSFRTRESGNESGGSIMKRTIFSALLTSAGLSAAAVSGTVHDASGAAIADAKVTLTNPDTAAKEETSTGPDGKFNFSGSSAGQYILRIEKPGLATIFREFGLKEESNVEREFTMPNEGQQAVADNNLTPLETPSKNIRVGGQVAQSNLTKKVQPIYPAAAKTSGIQGRVELEAVISKDGVPAELRVISSPSDDLSASSLEAVRQWRYRPTLLNGNPIEIVTTVVVSYTLSK